MFSLKQQQDYFWAAFLFKLYIVRKHLLPYTNDNWAKLVMIQVEDVPLKTNSYYCFLEDFLLWNNVHLYSFVCLNSLEEGEIKKMRLGMYFIRVTKPCFPPNEHTACSKKNKLKKAFQNTALMSGRPENLSYTVDYCGQRTKMVWSLSWTLKMDLTVCHHQLLKRETEYQWLFDFIFSLTRYTQRSDTQDWNWFISIIRALYTDQNAEHEHCFSTCMNIFRDVTSAESANCILCCGSDKRKGHMYTLYKQKHFLHRTEHS